MNPVERRQFLKQSLLSTMGLRLGASSIPVFLSNTLTAQAAGAAEMPTMIDAGKSHKILILLQLEGGNDGLNTVVPWEDKRYYNARKNIAIKEADLLKIDPIKEPDPKLKAEDEPKSRSSTTTTTAGKASAKEKKKKGSALGLHPEMTFFQQMYKDGKMAVINNVGYANPNRSHFKSGAIWQSGLDNIGWASEQEIERETGWLGRYFDTHCADENNFVGAYYGDSPLLMRGVAFSGTSIADIGKEPFGFMKLNEDFADTNIFRMLQERDPHHTGGKNSKVAFLRNVASETQHATDQMRRYLADSNSSGNGGYPNTHLGKQLKTISELILRGSSTRVYLAKIGGFDTHSHQAGKHASLWKQINEAMETFMGHMERAKLGEKVAVMTFSEFGRQVKENGTNGTDHGSAAPMFILGGGVKPGIYGNSPGLKSRDVTSFGGLNYEIDFRRVYRSIIEQFFKADSKAIISDIHQPIALFKGATIPELDLENR